MKLNIHDVETEAKKICFEEPTEVLNARLVHGSVCDFELHAPASVEVEHCRTGEEILLRGAMTGRVVGHCARCLEAYEFDLATEFSLILVPQRPLPLETELSGEDVDVSFYEGEEIDLSPLVHEQLLLALPTRALCREGCRGLCPQCGTDLNSSACSCVADRGDPRLAVLRTLKVAP